MADVFKQKITRYRLPNGRAVPKGTPGAVKVTEESPSYYADIIGADGKRHRTCLETSNKRAAQQTAAHLAEQARQQRLGLIPKETYVTSKELPLLVEEYRAILHARNRVAEHIQKTCQQILSIIEGCGFKYMADIDADRVLLFLASLRERPTVALPEQDHFTTRDVAALLGIQKASVLRLVKRGQLAVAGRAPGTGRRKLFHRDAVQAVLGRHGGAGVGASTSNHYLASMKAFTRWLWKKAKRRDLEPLAELQPMNEDVDRRHERRPLDAEAFTRLLNATEAGHSFRGISGPDRIAIYTLAVYTGLRANELGSLTPASFNLESATASVSVQAAYSKHRRLDLLPLRPDVAEMMRAYLAGRPTDRPLWPGTWADNAAEMLRIDLRAAGLPYEHQGKVFDFHAIRHMFVSLLAASGVPPKLAQVLARHSTITLTMDIYAHAENGRLAPALDNMPQMVRLPKPPALEQPAS